MLTLQHIAYAHPNKDVLFSDINITLAKGEKIALIGNNGIGKSSLLKMMAGILMPLNGSIKTNTQPYYVPQHFGQFNNMSVAQALHIEHKLQALKEILDGQVTETNTALLDDDWDIEERCTEALAHWGLQNINLEQNMSTLSGGQKTKIFLAGIIIHQPGIILLDEPTNHLDVASRQQLYEFIRTTNNTLVVVSHDRTLLNLLNIIYELGRKGIIIYGGNYDFYVEQKTIEANALNEGLKDKEKSLRKAKETERESLERQQKLDARGRKKQEKSGIPTIMMNTLRNNAEKSTAKMKDIHAEKINGIIHELNDLRKQLPDKDKMRIGFDNSALHKGKILLIAKQVNFSYSDKEVWPEPVDLLITSGERIALKGTNGSGKTTLIKLILGELQSTVGTIDLAEINAIYIDQDYSLIDNKLTVYEQAQKFNTAHLEEYEVKSKLTHFLFVKEHWDRPCTALSGGEKMRLILCCLTLSPTAPDIIILDEPTNNLDIQNIEILTTAINQYYGTLIVISHDVYFLKQINVNREILLRSN
jgi:ATPase subunit of ABC transporter with duplicated ATPase domains